MVNRHQKQCYKCLHSTKKKKLLHFPLKYLLDCSYIYTEVKDLWASMRNLPHYCTMALIGKCTLNAKQ